MSGRGRKCQLRVDDVHDEDRRTYLPLSGHRAITGGHTEEESVEFGEDIGRDDGVVRLGGSVHLLQNLLREGLRDPAVVKASKDVTIPKTYW